MSVRRKWRPCMDCVNKNKNKRTSPTKLLETSLPPRSRESRTTWACSLFPLVLGTSNSSQLLFISTYDADHFLKLNS